MRAVAENDFPEEQYRGSSPPRLLARKIFQAAAARRIVRIAGTSPLPGALHDEFPERWIRQGISCGDPEAIAERRIRRCLFNADRRSQLRLRYHRTVFAEIDDIACRVCAKIVTLLPGLPCPWRLDVMENRRHRDLRTLYSAGRAFVLARRLGLAGRTAIGHYKYLLENSDSSLTVKPIGAGRIVRQLFPLCSNL